MPGFCLCLWISVSLPCHLLSSPLLSPYCLKGICRHLDIAPLMGQSRSPFLRIRELSYRNMESSQLRNVSSQIVSSLCSTSPSYPKDTVCSCIFLKWGQPRFIHCIIFMSIYSPLKQLSQLFLPGCGLLHSYLAYVLWDSIFMMFSSVSLDKATTPQIQVSSIGPTKCPHAAPSSPTLS